jgi:hypothetical protein
MAISVFPTSNAIDLSQTGTDLGLTDLFVSEHIVLAIGVGGAFAADVVIAH